MLARLSRASVVSIASIRGRATGVGSELALASDMRFASREKATRSQWWPGSVIEQLKIIGPLTNPIAYGGKSEDSFDVVIPSILG
jgi:hypothetical protein